MKSFDLNVFLFYFLTENSCRFAKYFEIEGSKTTHFGSFDCSATMANLQYKSDSKGKSSSCC